MVVELGDSFANDTIKLANDLVVDAMGPSAVKDNSFCEAWRACNKNCCGCKFHLSCTKRVMIGLAIITTIDNEDNDKILVVVDKITQAADMSELDLILQSMRVDIDEYVQPQMLAALHMDMDTDMNLI